MPALPVLARGAGHGWTRHLAALVKGRGFVAVHQAGPWTADGQYCQRCHVRLLPEYHSGGGWPEGSSVYLWDAGSQSMLVKSDPTCLVPRLVRLNENADQPIHDTLDK